MAAMNRRVAGAAVALSLIVGVSAPAAAYTAIGMGNMACGEWTSARQYPNSDQAVADGQWILGFIAGAAYENGKDPLSGIDADGVWAWIDNYCAANPRQTQVDAATAFLKARIATRLDMADRGAR
jgi:hypothetical protein